MCSSMKVCIDYEVMMIVVSTMMVMMIVVSTMMVVMIVVVMMVY